MQNHFTLTRMAIGSSIRERKDHNKCWQGCGDIGTLIHYWWQCKMCSQSLQKLNLNVPLLGEMAAMSTQNLYVDVHSNIMHNSQRVGTPQMSSSWWWTNAMWSVQTTDVTVATRNMDPKMVMLSENSWMPNTARCVTPSMWDVQRWRVCEAGEGRRGGKLVGTGAPGEGNALNGGWGGCCAAGDFTGVPSSGCMLNSKRVGGSHGLSITPQ